MSGNTKDEIPDRLGPTFGMSFTRAQAEQLFRLNLNKTVISFEPVNGGYNNLLFFVQCEDDEQQYVLKLCGRFWRRIKTETEVAALTLIWQYTTIPVPRVLAYSSDKENEFGIEWIVMTRMHGQPLQPIWPDLSEAIKKSLIRQLAALVAQMHHRLPRYDKIGNLTSTGQIGPDLEGHGPWLTFSQFFIDRLQYQVERLNTNESFAPIRQDIMAAVDEFRCLPLPDFSRLPFIFTHGDLTTQNILVSNDESPQITAIVDWEWAGSFPCSEEYFLSYTPMLEDEKLREYLFDELERLHVVTPRTIPRFSLLRQLTDFQQELAPWYLTDVVDLNDPLLSKNLDLSRHKVQKLVEDLKKELIVAMNCD